MFDNSGMKIYLTPDERPVEVGSITFGVPLGPQQLIIPPGQKKFSVFGICPSECTETIPESGIYIFAGRPLTHLIGTKMY